MEIVLTQNGEQSECTQNDEKTQNGVPESTGLETVQKS
jgi:hypothetical protein